MALNVPVAFFVFRRPETTRRVFAEIARAKPKQLFVVADGGRTPEEEALCDATRKLVIDNIDWDCAVQTNFAERNLGLRARIASGLDWVFSNVERAIILEDDCLPHPTFFQFCATLLDHYADEQRVMHIGGTYLFDPPIEHYDASYYFTRYAHIWGWATWRRAWRQYDSELRGWLGPEKQRFLSTFETRSERAFWRRHLDDVLSGKINTWDSIWLFSCIIHGGLCINPVQNLVSNIGFGPDGVHTKDPNSPLSNQPSHAIAFPLTHPARLETRAQSDDAVSRLQFRHRSIVNRASRKMRHLARKYFGSV